MCDDVIIKCKIISKTAKEKSELEGRETHSTVTEYHNQNLTFR